MKLEFSGQLFEKYSNTKFNENPSSGSRVVPCGRTDGRKDVMTDMAKLIVVFRNFPNEPKNTHWRLCGYNERGRSGLSVISDKEPDFC
jgi:hypothetical protein